MTHPQPNPRQSAGLRETVRRDAPQMGVRGRRPSVHRIVVRSSDPARRPAACTGKPHARRLKPGGRIRSGPQRKNVVRSAPQRSIIYSRQSNHRLSPRGWAMKTIITVWAAFAWTASCVAGVCASGPAQDPFAKDSVFGAPAPASHPDDWKWRQAQRLQGIDGDVYALAVYGGQLIAGGNFEVAGDTMARNIAAWNGTSWLPLGSGINGPVYALTGKSSSLIAGGSFTEAGGVSANNIARWDGGSWRPLGLGIWGWVWRTRCTP